MFSDVTNHEYHCSNLREERRSSHTNRNEHTSNSVPDSKPARTWPYTWRSTLRDVWSIWLKDIRARENMTTIINAIDINGRTVYIHDIYPTSKSIRNEKVVFRDVPFSVNDKEIIKFLNDQSEITVTSGVISARIRANDNTLTPFYNGDKFVFVKGLLLLSTHSHEFGALYYSRECGSAWPACQKTVNRAPIAGGGEVRHNLHSSLSSLDSSTACSLCRLES